MPPKKKEQKQRYFFQYNEENLENAIKAVRENGTSKKLAARQFGIPRSTLIRKLAENVPLYRKMGPQTVLSTIEKQLLENWILAMARKGFPVHKNNLLLTVQTIIKEAGRDTCFKDSLPRRTWFEAFLKRHPRIKQKHAESVSKARATVTQDRIEAWFDEIHQFLKQEKLDGILEDESRIFNGDETGFMLCEKWKVTLFNKDDFSKKVLLKVEQKMEREELNAFLDTYSNKRAWTDNVESVNLYKVWSDNDNSQEIVTVENSGPTIDEIPNNEQSVENQEGAEFSDKNEDALTRLEAIDASYISPELHTSQLVQRI
ncbi:homeobox-like domain superfamily [Holotrichia oblita]|uniref:Homeobox-like domain superfamily n=1 Tax=Holotrichia oblita TaxID=644536 RepID=A0ACB9T1P3_HOLOL|nr:homeobox-like domain superfamily [Holotrichia oblita]